MKLNGWPELIIGTNKLPLKRGDHFTSDRFIGMLVRHFRNFDRVIVYTNFKHEEFASSIIESFVEAFKIVKEEKSIVEVTKRDGTKIRAIRIVLDKLPWMRK